MCNAGGTVAVVVEEFELLAPFKQRVGTLCGGENSGSRCGRHACTSPTCFFSTSPPPPWTHRIGATSGRASSTLGARGTTILCRTHYMDEAERCHDLSILEYGRIVGRARRSN